jgi:hypothetical protein
MNGHFHFSMPVSPCWCFNKAAPKTVLCETDLHLQHHIQETQFVTHVIQADLH